MATQIAATVPETGVFSTIAATFFSRLCDTHSTSSVALPLFWGLGHSARMRHSTPVLYGQLCQVGWKEVSWWRNGNVGKTSTLWTDSTAGLECKKTPQSAGSFFVFYSSLRNLLTQGWKTSNKEARYTFLPHFPYGSAAQASPSGQP